MPTSSNTRFNLDFNKHQKHLALKGLQPKTIDAYTRAMRRIGEHFHGDVYDLSESQLTDYFSQLLSTHSWSTVKLDLYGLKFFYQHVLSKPWGHIDLIKPPRASRLPDILTITEAASLFNATNKLSYRVFFFVSYSLGLRLGECLQLKTGDIDAARQRVHIRDAKGNKDRFVPLPTSTLNVLRRFWSVHRNPILLFPNRKGGLTGCQRATTPLDRGGVQIAMRRVTKACGIKKKLPHTVYDTVMQLTLLRPALVCLKFKKYSAIPA